MKKHGWILQSKRQGDLGFDLINIVLVGLITLLFAYPLYLVLISAFSTPNAVYRGEVLFWFQGSNWSGLQRVLSDDSLLRGYGNTIYYTVVGTAINLIMTTMLSRRSFALRTPLTVMFTITMFFGGGMIPTYLLVRNLNLLNTVWALVLPGAISTWNLIIGRTFLNMTISEELFDAAAIDGCNNFTFFIRIVLPLSSTLIAVLGLFYAVGHWNSYWSALLYITKTDMYPLQLVLRDILLQSQLSAQMMPDATDMENLQAHMQEIAESVKYIVVLAAVAPMMIVFPFVEKYFVKGVMIGSIKG